MLSGLPASICTRFSTFPHSSLAVARSFVEVERVSSGYRRYKTSGTIRRAPFRVQPGAKGLAFSVVVTVY